MRVTCQATAQMHMRRDGAVSEMNLAVGVYQVTVDTETRVFTSGNEVGVALIEESQIIAFRNASLDVSSYWEINRATGDYLQVSSAHTELRTVYAIGRGQCRTEAGATSF